MSITSSQQDWQTLKNSVLERNKYMFNNKLLSDVTFLVGHDEEFAKTVPAHKYVLSISSPVFYAMFSGELVEQGKNIRIPDSDPESFLEFLRYLYTDEVNLCECVQGVLYLASKYIVPSLTHLCVEFLYQNLNTDNVLGVLTQAIRYEDKKLQQRCWALIEKETTDVLKSEEFLGVSHDILELIIKSDFLDVTELDLFIALNMWATKQCEDRAITDKRTVLNGLFYHIHYPSISSEDFICYVLSAKILNVVELSEISELWVEKSHNSNAFATDTKYMQKPHKQKLKRCSRFLNSGLPDNFGWGGIGMGVGSPPNVDGISFSVDKPIRLLGARFYGDDELSEYVVSFQLLEDDGSCVAEVATKSYQSCITNGYSGYDVLFDYAVKLDANKCYHISSQIQGPWTYFCENGLNEVTCEGVCFKFINYEPSVRSGGTTVFQGVIPELMFY